MRCASPFPSWPRDKPRAAEMQSAPDHQPLTDAEMEAELDQAEADESRLDK